MLPLRPALLLSLLATALVAANLAHADVPAGSPFTPEQQTALQQLVASQVYAATPVMASAAAASALKSIQGEKQALEVAKDALEVGRKSVDFWLGFLGVLTGVIALFGVIAPWLVAKNYKADVEKQVVEIRKLSREAKNELSETIELIREAKSLLNEKFEALDEKVQKIDELAVKTNELAEAIDSKYQLMLDTYQHANVQLEEVRNVSESLRKGEDHL
ncbi:hypothetical protein ACG97_15260 [Vogesella sp. EB]|uniref:hypothetical protein n=1 Tax=Vogesella sp. EB TaxID=1526735 RepID=UPI00065D5DDC|nr:hypothetical protein [Vogesella sp. EB]KMJ52128.1 hypothetical protein ACG97_15260 [Vogesella sp. EB]